MARAQLITMVTRAADPPEPPLDYSPPFPAFDTTHYAFARRGTYAGLLGGLVGMGATYDFWADVTRGDVCMMLYKLLHG